MMRGQRLWKLGTLGAALLLPMAALAAPPPLLPVQGYLTDADDVPLDGEFSVTFRIFDAAEEGSQLFEEQQDVIFTAGAFVVYLGSDNPTDNPLDFTLMRDHADLFLELRVENDVPMTPRIRLGSAAFAGAAQYCGSADDAATLGGMAPADYQGRVTGSCPEGQAIRQIAADGTVTCEEDTDTVLNEGQVDGFVGNNCPAGQLMGGNGQCLALTRVRSTSGGPASPLTAVASCGSGILVGGGCTTDVGLAIGSSTVTQALKTSAPVSWDATSGDLEPADDQWFCACQAQNCSVTAYALCLAPQ